MGRDTLTVKGSHGHEADPESLCFNLWLLTTFAFAAEASCDSQATDKKLARAAKASFLKKCEADAATKPCDAQATEKKLAGAAKAARVCS